MPTKAPTRRLNGKKNIISSCPHTDDCVAPKMHKEVMGSIDSLALDIGLLKASVGLLLEQSERQASHLAGISERVTVVGQQEAEWLRQLGEMTRAVSALKGGSNA